MYACKNKLFKKFLFFSFVFLIFSICCNQFIYADEKVNEIKVQKPIDHIRIQQQKIISSLKKIESDFEKKGNIKK
jgi:hypothetical protein